MSSYYSEQAMRRMTEASDEAADTLATWMAQTRINDEAYLAAGPDVAEVQSGKFEGYKQALKASLIAAG